MAEPHHIANNYSAVIEKQQHQNTVVVDTSSPSSGALVAAGLQRKEGVSGLDTVVVPSKPSRALAATTITTTTTTTSSSCSMEGWVLLSVQFFERLSFHTLKGTLLPLFVGTLHVDEASANAFILLCIGVTVFTPIIGAAMADAKNGNYGVLASMFPLYIVGQLLFTIGPLIPGPSFLHPGLEKFALFFLVYICGGIRAVLPAYGADQVASPNGATQISQFFAFYYAMEQYAVIVAVTAIIPKLKGVAPWPVPPDQPFLSTMMSATGFLVLSTGLLIGTNQLFRKRVPSSSALGQNVFSRCYSTIKTAFYNKRRYKQRRFVLAKSRTQQQQQQVVEPKNLLDHFLDDHNCERDKECDFGRKNVCGQAKFLDDLRAVLCMMLLFVPMPLFWAYQSQMLSIWSIQRMNVDPTLPMVGPLLSPDQIGLLLNIFVLILIPLLYYLVYPSSMAQLFYMNTHPKRMASGIFLCALASAMSATVQFRLNTIPLQLSPNIALLKVYNIFPPDCAVSVVRLGDNGTGTGTDIQIVGNASSNDVPLAFSPNEVANGYSDLVFKFGPPSSCAGHRKVKIRMDVKAGKFHYAVVSPQGIMANAMDVVKPFPADGQTSVGVVIMLPCNSLDQQQLPAECARAGTQSSALAQALTPFGSPFALCPTVVAPLSISDNATDAAAATTANDDATGDATTPTTASFSSTQPSADTRTNNASSSASLSPSADASSTPVCTTWDLGDIQTAPLSVFPPRGDNLGPGSASIYALNTIAGGMYTVPPASSSASPPPAAGPFLDGSNSSTNANSTGSIWDSGIQLDGNGGVSLIVLSLDGSPLNGPSSNDSSSNSSQPMLTILTIAAKNTLGIHWLLPQYLMLALSDTLLSITALEFCYIQAPVALKATMIGYWLLMVYIGWSLVPLLARFPLSADPMVQLLVAACAMLMAGTLFAGLARFCYTSKDRLAANNDMAPTGGGGETPRRKTAAAQKGGSGGAGAGLSEMFSGLRASVARLPKRRVIRL